MTGDEARDEMLAVFKAAWDTTDYDANVVYSDKDGRPANAAAWARVVLRHADGGQASLADHDGKRRWKAIGTLWVQVYGPAGDGEVLTMALAQTVLNAYRTARGGGVWYRNPRKREAPSSGDFSQVNVLVDFQYDEVI
jgi:hypothetical protein